MALCAIRSDSDPAALFLIALPNSASTSAPSSPSSQPVAPGSSASATHGSDFRHRLPHAATSGLLQRPTALRTPPSSRSLQLLAPACRLNSTKIFVVSRCIPAFEYESISVENVSTFRAALIPLSFTSSTAHELYPRCSPLAETHPCAPLGSTLAPLACSLRPALVGSHPIDHPAVLTLIFPFPYAFHHLIRMPL